jgi:CubicO group peptidase (beta-lactamase class C family)
MHLDGLLAEAPMPAVAVSVFDREGVLYRGVARAEGDAWWDLASLTKVLVTLPEALARLELDVPIGELWPRAAAAPTAGRTVRQMLCHSTGLPATVEFFRSLSGREAIIDAALALPLQPAQGPIYSDIGYLLLGELIAYTTGSSLADLALARTGLRFGPITDAPTVPTERCPWRGRLISGEVHDENAWAMGGVSGHAGAFGTLDLVTAAARPVLDQPQRLQAANEAGERFSLGWWLAPTRGIGGPDPGANGFGHAGFVGNRVWFEPDHGYGLVILSNRVHPTRHADRAPFIAWCDQLLQTVAGELR